MDLPPVLMGTEHNRRASRSITAGGRCGYFDRCYLLLFRVFFRRHFHVRKLNNIRKRCDSSQRTRVALPSFEAGGILEVSEEMTGRIEALPGEHLDLRHD